MPASVFTFSYNIIEVSLIDVIYASSDQVAVDCFNELISYIANRIFTQRRLSIYDNVLKLVLIGESTWQETTKQTIGF